MDLFDRLFNDNENKIAVHTLYAALIDYAEGESTRSQIISGLVLEAAAVTDLDVLLAAIDGEAGVVNKIRWAESFHAVGLIAEIGLKYTDKASFRTRLGL